MAYFPFFMEIEHADGLIVGGGTVALRKVQKLLPYGPDLTVVAPEISPEILSLPCIRFLQEPFRDELLEDRTFVIAASNDPELNHRIALRCKERKIPVNTVDDRDYCTFLFPSLVKAGSLSIGISTGGASPSAAIYLRERIEELLPQQIDLVIEQLDRLRPLLKTALPTEKERAMVYKELFTQCIDRGSPLPETELAEYLQTKGIKI